MANQLALVLSLLAIVGCDRPSTGADGGTDGVDAASVDAGRLDAGSDDGGRDPDASTPRDAGPPPDAGPPDAGPEPCDTPGASETVPCGMCGTVERFCQSTRVWSYGECSDEGECTPGTSETTACGNCGSQQRRCTTACAWETVGACTGEGECAPGTMVTTQDGCPADQARQLLCNSACTLEVTAACAAETCTTPGATDESLPCGMCGARDRFCTSEHVWQYDACMDEGVCMPGTTGTIPCGMCGTRAARCTTECGWTPASGSVCMGEGECTAGTRQRTTMGCTGGQTRLVECDASCGYSIEIEPCRASVPIDVLFLVDATASNWFEFRPEQAAFMSSCVDPLLAITDVSVGLAYYGDFGTAPETFIGSVELGPATSGAISSSITALSSGLGGGDDSTMEALHILTGGTPQPGAVPFSCSAGRVAGGCWRPGAERVIVMHTDEFAKGGPDPASTGLYSPWPTGPSWTTVLPRLMTDGTLLFVIYDATDAIGTAQYQEMIADLGQPASDYYLQGGTASITPSCSAIVARVRAMAGM